VKTVDDEFASIIERALREADAIKCSKSDYRSALRAWKDEIDIALDAIGEEDE
jgi:hypothetical protein